MADASIKKPNWAEKKWAKIRSNGWALNLIYFLLIYHAVVIIAIGFGSSLAYNILNQEVYLIKYGLDNIIPYVANCAESFLNNLTRAFW